MKVYLLGGLGADTRVFHKLQWHNQLQPIVVEYIDPLPNELLHHYVQRLLLTMDTQSPFALIGLSFGGWVTMAMLQYVQPQKVVLLSSNASYVELPLHYKIVGKLNLHKILPVGLGKKFNFISKFMMGVVQKDNVNLLKQIFATSNTAFTKWAINVIMQNKLKHNYQSLIRIHGSKDYILPIKKNQPNYIINKGGHLIVLENAEEVSSILNKVLI